MIIVVDDSDTTRGLIMRIGEAAGFPTTGAATVEQALELLDAAPSSARLLVIVASVFAAEHLKNFVQHERKPKVLMTCVRPPQCPVVPVVQCAHLGCLQKPGDFRDLGALIERLKAMLS